MADSIDKNLSDLRQQGKNAIEITEKVSDLEALRVQYLGKKGKLTSQLKQIGSLPPEERPLFGDKVNQAKQQVAEYLQVKKVTLENV